MDDFDDAMDLLATEESFAVAGVLTPHRGGSPSTLRVILPMQKTEAPLGPGPGRQGESDGSNVHVAIPRKDLTTLPVSDDRLTLSAGRFAGDYRVRGVQQGEVGAFVRLSLEGPLP